MCVKHAILTDINHLPISVFFFERLCCPNIFYLFILCHVSLMLVCLSEFWVLCFVYLIGILSKNCVGVPQFRPGLILSISFMAFGSLGQQKYCETVYSRSGINHMWILKNSIDLLDNLKSRSFSQVSSIKTFDFSTLYTTLPHDKLKTRLKETIHKAFSHRNYGSKCVV